MVDTQWLACSSPVAPGRVKRLKRTWASLSRPLSSFRKVTERICVRTVVPSLKRLRGESGLLVFQSAAHSWFRRGEFCAATSS